MNGLQELEALNGQARRNEVEASVQDHLIVLAVVVLAAALVGFLA